MMKKALERRYRLLPYLYTVFYSASLSGVPVARSLVMEFAPELLGPGATFPYSKGRRGKVERRQVLQQLSTDSQFMLGPGISRLHCEMSIPTTRSETVEKYGNGWSKVWTSFGFCDTFC